MTSSALIWEYTDAELMAELSIVEYYAGVYDEDDKSYKPYGGGVSQEVKNQAFLASALLRIMRHLEMDKNVCERELGYKKRRGNPQSSG